MPVKRKRLAALVLAVLLCGCTPQQSSPTTQPTTETTRPSVTQPTVKVLTPVSAVCNLPDGFLNYYLALEYDAMGNLRAITRRNAQGEQVAKESYRYDDQGRVISVQPKDGLETTYHTYDAAGNRVRTEEGLVRQEYSYDAQGLLQTRELYAGDVLSQYTTYTYNAEGLPEKVQEYDSQGALLGCTQYTYNSRGWLLKAEEYDGAGSPPATVTYQYNAQGFLLGQEKRNSSGGLISLVRMTYDKRGNLLTVHQYDENLELQWWLEFAYGEIPVVEDNLTEFYTARKELLGF